MDDYDTVDEYGGEPAQSSIAAPLLRALLFAAVAFGIYALVFGDLGGDDDLVTTPTDEVVADVTPGATVPPPTVSAFPTTGPSDPGVALTPDPSPGATSGPAAPAGEVVPGTTVQVIAGANTTAQQVDAAVQVLAQMGYAVTEDGVSGNAYAQTTVFPSPGQEAAAEALVASDPRFAVVGENPGNLTDQLQIHVLVGEDFPV